MLTADSEMISKYQRLWEARPDIPDAGEFLNSMKLLQVILKPLELIAIIAKTRISFKETYST